MTIKSIVASAVFLTIAAQSQAVPITITQTFSSVDYYDYDIASGVAFGQEPTGDWIFSGTVDSEAVDLDAYSDIGMFHATNMTLTQAELGLDAVGINNMSYLYFYPDRFGFTFNVNTGAPWTRVIYETGHFLSASTLDEYLALATTPLVPNLDSGFGPQWDGFELADGRRLYGWGFAGGSVSVSEVSVPEPATLSLMLAALGMAALRRRDRKPI